MKKINVFQIAGGYDCSGGHTTAGGVEIHLLYMNRKIDASRFNIIVGYNGKGALVREYKDSELWNYEDFCIESRFDVPSLKKLFTILKKHNIDVIHGHGELGILYCLLASKLLGIPAVFTIPSFQYEKGLRAFVFKAFYRIFCRFYDKTITVSKRFAKRLIREDFADANKITTIYNGVALSDFKGLEKEYLYKEFPLSPSNKIIGIAGQLQDFKAHEYFIEAACFLIQKRSDLQFLIVGDGPRRECLERMVESKGLSSKTVFTGFRKDIANLISSMDILVNSSIREGVPMVFLEAMVQEKPIVATDIGGNSEAVLHGINGLIVPQRDSRALAASIEELLGNDNLRERFGKAGRKHLEDNFLVERMAREHEALYKEIAGKKIRNTHRGDRDIND